MARTESDGLRKIKASFLREHGYFKSWYSGSIIWTSGYSGEKNSVGVESKITEGDNYIRIYYTQTDRNTEEKKDFDYKIPLTTTPCRYGGKRYWFTCPWYKNGKYCGKRVATLYKGGDYYACRHCYNLTYASRNLSGMSKRLGSITCPDVDELQAKVKRTYYRGKYTKKYLRYLKADRKLENAFIGMGLFASQKLARKTSSHN